MSAIYLILCAKGWRLTNQSHCSRRSRISHLLLGHGKSCLERHDCGANVCNKKNSVCKIDRLRRSSHLEKKDGRGHGRYIQANRKPNNLEDNKGPRVFRRILRGVVEEFSQSALARKWSLVQFRFSSHMLYASKENLYPWAGTNVLRYASGSQA